MSEPPKPAEPAPKAAEDFVTKYKVRLTLRDANPHRFQEVENLLTSLLNVIPLGLRHLIVVLMACSWLRTLSTMP